MTTKPKAQRFRLKGASAPRPAPAPVQEGAAKPTPPRMATDGGAGGQTYPTRDKTAAASALRDEQTPAPQKAQKTAPEPETAAPEEAYVVAGSPEDKRSVDQQLEAIRKEGLTGRQLRMARRVAQKQGLEPDSDYDAIRQLRGIGVDPFRRTRMLELVTEDSAAKPNPTGQEPVGAVQLPTTLAVAQEQLPSTDVARPGSRESDIMSIQRDIAKRRRKRAMFLAARLGVFVFLPTLLAGIYFAFIATPMYSTHSGFIIQQAEAPAGGQLGGLFSGTSLATSQDSITVQDYMQSREAMRRLDVDEGFKDHFSGEDVDGLQRLPDDASDEDAYRIFRKHVRIGYDPTEGLIRMEVVAASPEASERFSRKLISYAEQRVDELTSRLRADQMDGAEASRREANDKMIAAQQRIVFLQEKLGVLSPESEVQAIFGQISQLETELLTERLSLRQFLGNARPNQARVQAAENKIAELERLISEKRAQLTTSGSEQESLARVSGELLVAQADLETRQALLAQAEAQFESARLEANRQVRYLSVGVSPVASDEPSYPKTFENTALAFLIFAGIYLMVSLTASILREQV